MSAPKQDSTEVPLVIGRRSARLSMIIPITIHGVGSAGQAFKENTWTIGVNKQGAKIATFHPLPLGGQISIVNPVLGRTAKARVIWVGEKRFPEDPFEIGVELTEAQNVWGIKFPPEDWQRPTPIGPSVRAAAAASEPPTAAKPLPPGATKPSDEAAAESPKESGAPPENFNQFNLALAALSQFAQQAEVKPAEKPAGQEATPPPAPVETAPSQAPQAAFRAPELSERLSLNEQVKSLSDRLQAATNQVESLLARAEETRQGWQAEAEKARGALAEAGKQAVDSTLRDLETGLRERAEVESVRALEETGQRMRQVAANTAEGIRQEASARLAQLTQDFNSRALPELQTRQDQVIEEAKEKITRAAQQAASEAEEKIGRMAVERGGALHPELEKSLKASAQQTLDRLAYSFDELARETSRQAERAFQEKLEKMHHQLQEETAAAGLKIRQSAEQETEGFRKIVVNRVDWAVDSLNLATGSAAAKLHAAYRKAENDAKSALGDYPRKMGEITNTSLQGFQQKIQDLGADFQSSLEKTWSDFREKTARESVEHLQKTAENWLESSTQELQKHGEDIRELVSEQLKATAAPLVDDARKQILGAARSGRDALMGEAKAAEQSMKILDGKLLATGKALLDDAAARLGALSHSSRQALAAEARATELALKVSSDKLRTSSKAMGEEVATHLRTMAGATLDSLSKGAQAIAEDYRGRVQKTVQEFQEKSVRELQSHLERASGRQRESLLAELQQEARDSTNRALERMRSNSEQVAQQTSDTVYKQVGMGAAVLKDWADQSRAQLEAYFQRSMDSFQKQVSGFSEGVLEGHRQKSESLTEDLRLRLGQAAEIFQQKSAAARKPAGMAGEAPQPSSLSAGDAGEEAADPVAQRLKEIQERAVSDLMESFRSKLAEMFSATPPVEKDPSADRS